MLGDGINGAAVDIDLGLQFQISLAQDDFGVSLQVAVGEFDADDGVKGDFKGAALRH